MHAPDVLTLPDSRSLCLQLVLILMAETVQDSVHLEITY